MVNVFWQSIKKIVALSILVLACGVAWGFRADLLQKIQQLNIDVKEIARSPSPQNLSPETSAILQALVAKYPLDSIGKEGQLQELVQAIMALEQTKMAISKTQRDAALLALKQGDTTKAKALLSKETQRTGLPAGQSAVAFRHLGAFASLDSPMEALQAYRHATQLDSKDVGGWESYARLSRRTGNLPEAITAYNMLLALAETSNNKREMADIYCKLGDVYQTQGDLDKAIEVYDKALDLDTSQERKVEVANQYGNLASLFYTRGRVHKATDFYEKSLALHESLGNKEGMAISYGNLGLLYFTQAEQDKAVEFQQKALEINQSLGRKEGMSQQYVNLGLLYQTKGELEKAIEFYGKSLAIEEGLKNKEGMANQYGNLGNAYMQQGNTAEAKRNYVLSVGLFKELHHPNAQRAQALLETLEKPWALNTYLPNDE